ncbi:hypothetical protein ScPMuIL_006252 [Solemya velum]
MKYLAAVLALFVLIHCLDAAQEMLLSVLVDNMCELQYKDCLNTCDFCSNLCGQQRSLCFENINKKREIVWRRFWDMTDEVD